MAQFRHLANLDLQAFARCPKIKGGTVNGTVNGTAYIIIRNKDK